MYNCQIAGDASSCLMPAQPSSYTQHFAIVGDYGCNGGISSGPILLNNENPVEAVAGMVKQMDGAIGYVELIYALQNKISFGPVKNAAGDYVKASLESTTAAAAPQACGYVKGRRSVSAC